MLGLLDFVVWIVDSLVYWRVCVGVALTGLAVFLLVVVIQNDLAQWIIVAPIAALGVFLAFRWQHGAELGA